MSVFKGSSMNTTVTDPKIPSAQTREIVSINPATLKELGRAPISTAEGIAQALAKARAAQPGWASLSFKERAKFILKAKDVLLERQDEICELIARETGKPVVE